MVLTYIISEDQVGSFKDRSVIHNAGLVQDMIYCTTFNENAGEIIFADFKKVLIL